MIKGFFFSEPVGGKGGLSLLLLRLVSGAAMTLHGWPKFQNAFNWMGPDAPVPGFLQALAAFSEFMGGMALVVGLLTKLSALGIWFTMSFALFVVHIPKGDPFVSMGGPSWELAAVYWVIMSVLILRGAGAYSLDSLFFKKSS